MFCFSIPFFFTFFYFILISIFLLFFLYSPGPPTRPTFCLYIYVCMSQAGSICRANKLLFLCMCVSYVLQKLLLCKGTQQIGIVALSNLTKNSSIFTLHLFSLSLLLFFLLIQSIMLVVTVYHSNCQCHSSTKKFFTN